MNFNEWFKKFSKTNVGDYEFVAKESWDACKKEILKQLKGFEGEYVCDVIDRIKKV